MCYCGIQNLKKKIILKDGVSFGNIFLIVLNGNSRALSLMILGWHYPLAEREPGNRLT